MYGDVLRGFGATCQSELNHTRCTGRHWNSKGHQGILHEDEQTPTRTIICFLTYEDWRMVILLLPTGECIHDARIQIGVLAHERIQERSEDGVRELRNHSSGHTADREME